jgi:hypothetical protein
MRRPPDRQGSSESRRKFEVIDIRAREQKVLVGIPALSATASKLGGATFFVRQRGFNGQRVRTVPGHRPWKHY